jgi:coproporphyrinogen III oxidase-like Fe-S oxidoreductase
LPTIPDPDTAADMYEETVKIARDYGYTHYEVSSYAKNEQAISRHNFSYWQGMDYLGLLLYKLLTEYGRLNMLDM